MFPYSETENGIESFDPIESNGYDTVSSSRDLLKSLIAKHCEENRYTFTQPYERSDVAHSIQ